MENVSWELVATSAMGNPNFLKSDMTSDILKGTHSSELAHIPPYSYLFL